MICFNLLSFFNVGIREVCDVEKALGLLWKKTIAGRYSAHPCPRGAKGGWHVADLGLKMISAVPLQTKWANLSKTKMPICRTGHAGCLVLSQFNDKFNVQRSIN